MAASRGSVWISSRNSRARSSRARQPPFPGSTWRSACWPPCSFPSPGIQPCQISVLPERARAFYGRRKGHALKRQQAMLLETLLPKLAVDLAAPAPGALSELFSDRPADVCLEIGFGAASI